MAKTSAPRVRAARVDTPTPSTPPAPGPSFDAPSQEKPAATASERLSLPIDADGRIDWESMRPSTRDKLKAALSDVERVGRELGTPPPSVGAGGATAAENAELNSMIAAMIYDGISNVLVLSAKAAEIPDEYAELMRYTEKQKADWLKPTQDVLARYSLLNSPHAPLIALLSSVSMTTLGMWMQMQQRFESAKTVGFGRTPGAAHAAGASQ